VSKKRKRKSHRQRTPNLPSQTTIAARQAAARKEVNLAEDYAYVAADLGRIALIAGVMLAVLVALSFILR
jgi:hypothetical protein